MSDVKILKTVSLETFKKNNSLTTIDVFLSKNDKKYCVVDGECIMFSEKLDVTKEMHVVTVQKGDDIWSFLGNSTLNKVGTI